MGTSEEATEDTEEPAEDVIVSSVPVSPEFMGTCEVLLKIRASTEAFSGISAEGINLRIEIGDFASVNPCIFSNSSELPINSGFVSTEDTEETEETG